MNYITAIKKARTIAIIGNGGNLAICRHAASDMSRHLSKFCFEVNRPYISLFELLVLKLTETRYD